MATPEQRSSPRVLMGACTVARGQACCLQGHIRERLCLLAHPANGGRIPNASCRGAACLRSASVRARVDLRDHRRERHIVSHRGRKPARTVIRETHEPDQPIDWPHGHVGVDLTPDDVGECVLVTIHGVQHYLHSTTARELNTMLEAKLDEWNDRAMEHGARGV